MMLKTGTSGLLKALMTLFLSNWSKKRASKQVIAVLITKRFTLYWFLIKLENVMINRIHSLTSLRGAFNRMFSFGLQIDSPRKQTFLLAHRHWRTFRKEEFL